MVQADRGNVAIVTGGEKGIGRGIVERLHADGWLVAVAGIDEVAGSEVESSFNGVRFFACEVSNEDAVSKTIGAVVENWGRIDGLVLNAGIASPKRVPLENLALSDWEEVLAVNLTGAFLCAKHARETMRKTGGSIVAITSTRARMSEPNTFAYSASKGGLLALTHALAMSLGPEIRVNSVSPGWIHTGGWEELRERDHRQHAVGRVGRPSDIAAMVAYLLGPDSGFVTGQDFVVDGGMTKKMIYEE